MKGRIILNSVLVATLLLSRAVFADTNPDNQDAALQQTSVQSSAEAMTANLQTRLESENHEEVVARILVNSREELSQVHAHELLAEALKDAQDYLKSSVNGDDDNVRLTAR